MGAISPIHSSTNSALSGDLQQVQKKKVLRQKSGTERAVKALDSSKGKVFSPVLRLGLACFDSPATTLARRNLSANVVAIQGHDDRVRSCGAFLAEKN